MIVNAGVPGDNTADLLSRFDRAVPATTTLVVLLIGTNDMLYVPKLNTIETYEENMKQLIKKVRHIPAELLLCTYPHCVEKLYFTSYGQGYPFDIAPNARLDAGCDTLRNLANKEQIPLFDFARAANRTQPGDPSSWIRSPANETKCPDGLHLTAEGARALARGVARCIQSYGLNSAHTVCLGDSLTFGVGLRHHEKYPALLEEL